jgi:hypothetical protein
MPTAVRSISPFSGPGVTTIVIRHGLRLAAGLFAGEG